MREENARSRNTLMHSKSYEYII